MYGVLNFERKVFICLYVVRVILHSNWAASKFKLVSHFAFFRSRESWNAVDDDAALQL